VKVTNIVAEIAAATSEQSTGVDQINHAISNMDTATQQNAALVEESAAAAKSMQQQAQKLQELGSFFRLGGQAAYAAAPSYSGGGLHLGQQRISAVVISRCVALAVHSHSTASLNHVAAVGTTSFDVAVFMKHFSAQ